MSNEELTVLIQAGEREYLPQLWAQVERFVAKQASRRMTATGGFGGVEFGDLYDSGYIALVAAAESFDPEAGGSFIGWLALHLKTAFAEAGDIAAVNRRKTHSTGPEAWTRPWGTMKTGPQWWNLSRIPPPSWTSSGRRNANTGPSFAPSWAQR